MATMSFAPMTRPTDFAFQRLGSLCDELIDLQFKLIVKDRLLGCSIVRNEHLDKRFFPIALNGGNIDGRCDSHCVCVSVVDPAILLQPRTRLLSGRVPAGILLRHLPTHQDVTFTFIPNLIITLFSTLMI